MQALSLTGATARGKLSAALLLNYRTFVRTCMSCFLSKLLIQLDLL
jgi:hypothetical protein